MLSGNLRYKKSLYLCLLMISLTGVGLNVSAAQLIVKDAWIALAPPGVAAHAAYLHLVNNNKKSLTITQMVATHYSQVLLHQTKIVNDKVQMEHAHKFEIFADSSLFMTPGATHLMLIKPQKIQKINDQVSITLTFDDGSQQQVIASVQSRHE
jgi:periplasmic copper chaperone A